MTKPLPSFKDFSLNLSGFGDLERDFREHAEAEIDRTIKKILKIVKVEELIIDLKIHEKDGKKKKFTLNARLSTERGLLISSSYDWKFPTALKETLENLERQVIEEKHKTVDAYHTR